MVEEDQDQALVSTKTCLQWQCQKGWDMNKPIPRPIYPLLVKKGAFWCCPNCGGSYGTNPHPDLN